MIPRVFLAFLAFGMVGCGGVDVTDPGSVSGTYTLRTVAGDALPAVLLQEVTTSLLEVTAGNGTLNQDLTCSVSLTLRGTGDGTVTTITETNACTYALDSGSITVTIPDGVFDPDPLIVSGSITGSTITVTGPEGNVFVFRK